MSEQDCEGRACTKKRRGVFQPDTYSLQTSQSPVQSLPADVLLQIFASLSPKAQRETLPLVCRQWHEVLQGPVALWRHLELDFPAAMDLGLDGARLTPSRRFQVCCLVTLDHILLHTSTQSQAVLKHANCTGTSQATPPLPCQGIFAVTSLHFLTNSCQLH